MTRNPAAAQHLAELDARFEGHLAALRQRTVEAKDAVNATAEAMGPRRYPPKHPTTRIDLGPPPERDAIPDFEPIHEPHVPDAPLGSVDDDGIPLWDDQTS